MRLFHAQTGNQKSLESQVPLPERSTPPKFNSSPLKNGPWKDKPASYWVSVTFQGRAVKLREGTVLHPK